MAGLTWETAPQPRLVPGTALQLVLSSAVGLGWLVRHGWPPADPSGETAGAAIVALLREREWRAALSRAGG